MSDFDPLKSDQSFAGSLLRSAASDAPSAQTRRLVASGLGLMAAASVTPSALAAGQTALTAATAVPTGVKSIGTLVVSKWLVSSVVAGVVASAAAVGVHEVVSVDEAPSPALVRPRVAQAASRKPQPAQATPVPAPVPVPSAKQRSEAAAPSLSVPRAASGEPRSRPSTQQVLQNQDPASLDEEIAWLEPARRSLQAKNGRQALAALERATPHVRLLTSEAALLRVEALLLVGRRAEAERIAEPFLSRSPASPHAQRLRRLLGQP